MKVGVYMDTSVNHSLLLPTKTDHERKNSDCRFSEIARKANFDKNVALFTSEFSDSIVGVNKEVLVREVRVRSRGLPTHDSGLKLASCFT